MAMLLGKKIGMTQIYNEDGRMQSVTVIEAGPCTVMQIKTQETDGYNAVQMGFEDKKASRIRKPEEGHAKKASATAKRFIREYRMSEEPQQEVGTSLTVAEFAEVPFVDVSGISKGKGFAGTMKRHNFGGFPASHGTERKHRAPGSLASFASDAGKGGNIKKGKRMAGHMGAEKVTTKNHKVISLDEEKNLLIVKGGVPGPSGGYLVIRTSKKG